jgi:hypothetical protein
MPLDPAGGVAVYGAVTGTFAIIWAVFSLAWNMLNARRNAAPGGRPTFMMCWTQVAEGRPS